MTKLLLQEANNLGDFSKTRHDQIKEGGRVEEGEE